MDHRQVLATLSPEERASLTARADAPGLCHLACHLGAIGVSTALILVGVPGWPLVMVVQGVLLVFLFTLLHETVHDTPFATRWITRVVGQVCGFVLFIPALWFRYFHFAHHRYTQIPGKDPELDSALPQTGLEYARHISGLPVWIAACCTLIRNATGACADRYVPDARRCDITREARYMLMLYLGLLSVSVVTGSASLIWIWLLPIVLGQPFLRAYLLAEHGRCSFVANMLENTRTTYTNRLMRWLAWNMPYHAEHHSLPTVPFHRLPDLNQRMAQHLKVTEQGYSRFNTKYARDLR